MTVTFKRDNARIIVVEYLEDVKVRMMQQRFDCFAGELHFAPGVSLQDKRYYIDVTMSDGCNEHGIDRWWAGGSVSVHWI